MYGIERRICGGSETPSPERRVVAALVIPKIRDAPKA
jgi:hypothetical protein